MKAIGILFLAIILVAGCATTTVTNPDGSTTSTTKLSASGKLIVSSVAYDVGSFGYMLVPKARTYLTAICALSGNADAASSMKVVIKEYLGQVWVASNDAVETAVVLKINSLMEQFNEYLGEQVTDSVTLEFINLVIASICKGVAAGAKQVSATVNPTLDGSFFMPMNVVSIRFLAGQFGAA